MAQQINDNFQLLAGLPIDDRNRKSTIAERDAISATRRFQGLQCFVEQTQTLYQLTGGILNSNWVGIAGNNSANELETVIEGFYVLSAGKTTILDWELGDKFRGWIDNRYVVGSILSLPVSLPEDIDNSSKVFLAIDSEDLSLSSGFINIKDLGGIGDGVFDNTSIINNALETYKEVYFPDGNYLVTSLVNDLGSKITGSGIIVKAITGGTQQLNTGIDRYNYIFGQEYLSFVQNKIINRGNDPLVNIKVSWSGDSTTSGDGTTTGYTLVELFKESTVVNGIANVTCLNRGHSGQMTEQWRTTYLSDDLAENPDLYIVRWGINDPYYLKNGTLAPADAGDAYPNRRDIGDFETSLRSALTTLRASKTQAQMSVILMSPNPTSDTPNARDEKWYEQVRKVYLQASRDFKCAFIDTYSLWLDSRGAADLYMDNPYSDGRAIHPKNVYNTWIVSKVFDLVFPSNFLDKTASNNLTNESSADRLPVKSDLPETYRRGLSINRAFGTPAWSVDGTVTTFFNTDGSGFQLNTSNSISNPKIFFRSFMNQYLVVPLAWSDEVELWHSGNLVNALSGDSDINVQGSGKFGNPPTYYTEIGSDATNAFIRSFGISGVFLIYDTIGKPISMQPFGGNVLFGSTTDDTVNKVQITGSAKITSLAGTGDRLVITESDGKIKAGDVAPTSGAYTPTLTNVTNVTGLIVQKASYIRIGNIINVRVAFEFNITSTSVNSRFTITFPVNRANATSFNMGSGSVVSSNTPNDLCSCVLTSGSTSNVTVYFVPTATASSYSGSVNFQYSVLD